MTKEEFALKILHTDCLKCPIAEYCSLLRNESCTTVAKKYYDTHGKEKGVLKLG